MAGAMKYGVVEIHGRFLEPDPKLLHNREEEEEEDVDDFQDFDFKQLNSLAAGAHNIETKVIKRKTECFQDFCTGGKYTVKGPFFLTEPFWSAKIKVYQNRKTVKYMFPSTYPSYELCGAHLQAAEKLVEIFVTKCYTDVVYNSRKYKQEEQEQETYQPDEKQNFFDKVRQYGRQLTFESLFEFLNELMASDDEVERRMGASVSTTLQISEIGRYVRQAVHTPKLFQYLPRLLPLSAANLLLIGDEKLQEIETAISKCPWVFGFRQILSFRYKILGCECQLKHFEEAGLIHDMPQAEKDALYIYDFMKTTCKNKGHTYLPDNFKQVKMFGDYKVQDQESAMEFLEQNRVIHRERNKKRVYLRRLWKSETDIDQCIDDLYAKQSKDPWSFEVDLESPEFAQLKKDPHQVKAVQMIGANPVVVISGKGGCGKTTVVSAVFQYAERLIALEIIKKMTEEKEAMEEDDLSQSLLDEDVSSRSTKDTLLDYFSDTKEMKGGDHKMQTSVMPASDGAAAASSFSLFVDEGIEEDSLDLGEEFGADMDMSCKDETQDVKQLQAEEHTQMDTENPTDTESKKDAETTEEGATGMVPTGEKENPNELPISPYILLTAPTGKAANLIGRRTNIRGFTLHQVIFRYKMWCSNKNKAEKEGTKVEDFQFRKIKALVVDECSLVAVTTFSTMLQILMKESDLRKIVLLGDEKQLPSIEPGNFLSDTFEAFKNMRCSLTLSKNYRSGVELIVKNATRISERIMPQFDPSRSFHLEKTSESNVSIGKSKVSYGGSDLEKTVQRVLLRKNPSIGTDRTSQFVAFKRKDCEAINEICCRHYCNHDVKTGGKFNFQPGDKVCCTKNGYVTDLNLKEDLIQEKEKMLREEKKREAEMKDKETSILVKDEEGAALGERGEGGRGAEAGQELQSQQGAPEKNEESSEKKAEKAAQLRLCNGEIFFIQDIKHIQVPNGKEDVQVWISDEERTIRTRMKELTGHCRLKHAWARTIHTYQGSETDTVIYVVGGTAYQTWQHVYTAVTRGKYQVFILSCESTLRECVQAKPVKRNTSLKERLIATFKRLHEMDRQSTSQKHSKDLDATMLTPSASTQGPRTHTNPSGSRLNLESPKKGNVGFQHTKQEKPIYTYLNKKGYNTRKSSQPNMHKAPVIRPASSSNEQSNSMDDGGKNSLLKNQPSTKASSGGRTASCSITNVSNFPAIEEDSRFKGEFDNSYATQLVNSTMADTQSTSGATNFTALKNQPSTKANSGRRTASCFIPKVSSFPVIKDNPHFKGVFDDSFATPQMNSTMGNSQAVPKVQPGPYSAVPARLASKTPNIKSTKFHTSTPVSGFQMSRTAEKAREKIEILSQINPSVTTQASQIHDVPFLKRHVDLTPKVDSGGNMSGMSQGGAVNRSQVFSDWGDSMMDDIERAMETECDGDEDNIPVIPQHYYDQKPSISEGTELACIKPPLRSSKNSTPTLDNGDEGLGGKAPHSNHVRVLFNGCAVGDGFSPCISQRTRSPIGAEHEELLSMRDSPASDLWDDSDSMDNDFLTQVTELECAAAAATASTGTVPRTPEIIRYLAASVQNSSLSENQSSTSSRVSQRLFQEDSLRSPPKVPRFMNERNSPKRPSLSPSTPLPGKVAKLHCDDEPS